MRHRASRCTPRAAKVAQVARSQRRGAKSQPIEIALILIHGIGIQEEGSLLRQTAALLSDPANPPAFFEASSTNPEYARVQATIRGRRVQLLLVEGWWDEPVSEITIGKAWAIYGWLAQYLPVIIYSSGVIVVRHIWLRRKEDSGRRLNPFSPRDMLTIIRAMQALFLRLLVWPLLLFPVVYIVLPCLLLARSSYAVKFMESVIGDAWAFTRDRASQDVISHRVSDAIAWARRTARRVVLVGHSQGGAIAREATVGRQVDALVTVGSGAVQLAMLRMGRAVMIVSWLALVTFPFECAYFFPAFFAGSPSAFLIYLAWPTLLFLLGIPLLWRYRNARILATPRPAVVRWIDVYSRYDPVPGGASIERQAIPCEVINAGNLRDVAFEHVRYFQNDQVKAVLRFAAGETLSRSRPDTEVALGYYSRWHETFAKWYRRLSPIATAIACYFIVAKLWIPVSRWISRTI